MAKNIAVFQSSQNPSIDKPEMRSKSQVAKLVRSNQVVKIGDRVFQFASCVGVSAPESRHIAVARPRLLTYSEKMYDDAANAPPAGYRETSPTKLMLGQMWEKRKSANFEILQLCPPHRKPDVTEATA